MLRQIIVNADDFGYTPGVSQGILEAHLNGIVTSTSVMVNMPAAEQWVKTALKEAPDLGLGLHLRQLQHAAQRSDGQPMILPARPDMRRRSAGLGR